MTQPRFFQELGAQYSSQAHLHLPYEQRAFWSTISLISAHTRIIDWKKHMQILGYVVNYAKRINLSLYIYIKQFKFQIVTSTKKLKLYLDGILLDGEKKKHMFPHLHTIGQSRLSHLLVILKRVKTPWAMNAIGTTHDWEW